MSLTRREFVRIGAGAGAALLVPRLPLVAVPVQASPIVRAIPRTGERLPVVGLGSVSMFGMGRGGPGSEAGREVIRLFHALGGRVIDTAPGYGNAEPFIGGTVRELGVADHIFVATKFNALQIQAGRGVRASGGGAADQAVMEEQLAASLDRFGRRALDLQQIWNLGDTQANAQRVGPPAGVLERHVEKALEWKAEGRVRYVGITTSRAPQYEALERAMARWPIDFIQVDYSIDNLAAGERLLPAAQDRGIAVLVNRPFGSGSLFRQASARGLALPPWAAELGITSWAQYFLKFIVSHPAVTAALPSTGNPRNLRDNMGAAVGELPDAATRGRMVGYWGG